MATQTQTQPLSQPPDFLGTLPPSPLSPSASGQQGSFASVPPISSLPTATPIASLPSGAEAERANEMEVLSDASELRLSQAMTRLPVDLEVRVPVREFRVRHLLAMAAGEVIETRWANGEDLPLSSGEVQLAWSEFEVMDSRLAVRVTRLA